MASGNLESLKWPQQHFGVGAAGAAQSLGGRAHLYGSFAQNSWPRVYFREGEKKFLCEQRQQGAEGRMTAGAGGRGEAPCAQARLPP